MELGDVKVRLDGAQFPCLIFQKHPELFQSCPEGFRREKKLVKKKRQRVEKVKRRCWQLSITDLIQFCVMRRLLCSEIPNWMCCKGHWHRMKRKRSLYVICFKAKDSHTGANLLGEWRSFLSEYLRNENWTLQFFLLRLLVSDRVWSSDERQGSLVVQN